MRDELIDVTYIVAASEVYVSALCVINELPEQGADFAVSILF
jgi:hypothetical protein